MHFSDQPDNVAETQLAHPAQCGPKHHRRPLRRGAYVLPVSKSFYHLKQNDWLIKVTQQYTNRPFREKPAKKPTSSYNKSFQLTILSQVVSNSKKNLFLLHNQGDSVLPLRE